MGESNPNVRGVRRREEIISSARALFASAGYSGVSMSQIASHAGVTHAGLLYHFATKEDLLDAVMRGHAPEPSPTEPSPTEHSSTETGDALERLRELVAHNSEDREWMRLFSTLTGEAVSTEHPLHDSFSARYSAIASGLAASLGDIASASVSPAEFRGLARLLIAAMDGLQLQATMSSADPEALAARMRADFDLTLELVRTRLGLD